MRRKNLSAEEQSLFEIIESSFPDVAIIFPSSVGLGRSIIDAHASLRLLMVSSGYHDYAKQRQGELSKIFGPSIVFDGTRAYSYDLSLYRPDSKDGDPRFWPSILKKDRVQFPLSIRRIEAGPSFSKVCAPDDGYAAIVIEGVLVMIRLEKRSLGLFSDQSQTSEIKERSVVELREWILNAMNTLSGNLEVSQNISEAGFSYKQADEDEFVVSEIVEKLQGYAGRFVVSRGSGDMGVGKTIEWMLGIQANSSKEPDFKGIEIKSARTGQSKNKLTTLFSKTPDRKISPMKPFDVVMNFGRPDEETQRHQVYATVGPERSPRNTMGFFTNISNDGLNFELRNQASAMPLFIWPMDTLRVSLSRKHRRTMWISVEARKINGCEEFKVLGFKLTGSPSFDSFLSLVRAGKITIDLTMSLKGVKRAVRDHGYLFRIDNAYMDGLFLSPPKVYNFL